MKLHMVQIVDRNHAEPFIGVRFKSGLGSARAVIHPISEFRQQFRDQNSPQGK